MTDRIYGRQETRWEGQGLHLLTGRLIAIIEPDALRAGLFRVRFPDGHLTDAVNLTRAKDAAVALGLAKLNAGRAS